MNLALLVLVVVLVIVVLVWFFGNWFWRFPVREESRRRRALKQAVVVNDGHQGERERASQRGNRRCGDGDEDEDDDEHDRSHRRRAPFCGRRPQHRPRISGFFCDPPIYITQISNPVGNPDTPMQPNRQYFYFTPQNINVPTILFMPFHGKAGDQIKIVGIGNGDVLTPNGTWVRVKAFPTRSVIDGGSGRSQFIYFNTLQTAISTYTDGWFEDKTDNYPTFILTCTASSSGCRDVPGGFPSLWNITGLVTQNAGNIEVG